MGWLVSAGLALALAAGSQGRATRATIPAMYHGDRERADALADIHRRCPTITHLYSIGMSVEGRDLQAIEFSSTPGVKQPGVPRVRLVGNIHGDELVGHEILLKLAGELCDRWTASDAQYQTLIRTTSVHIVPTVNPDGFNRTLATLSTDNPSSWCDYMHDEGLSAPTYKMHQNANGCDLNHNFPGRFGKENRYQEHCGVQPETQAVMDWAMSGNFTLAINFQAGSHVLVTYPFDNLEMGMSKNSPSPDDATFRHLSTLYASHMAELPVKCSDDSNDPIPASHKYDSGIANGAEYYTQQGTLQDWTYVHTSALELSVSVSCCRHPPTSELERWWNQHQNAIIAFLTDGPKSGVRGFILERVDGSTPNKHRRQTENDDYDGGFDLDDLFGTAPKTGHKAPATNDDYVSWAGSKRPVTHNQGGTTGNNRNNGKYNPSGGHNYPGDNVDDDYEDEDPFEDSDRYPPTRPVSGTTRQKRPLVYEDDEEGVVDDGEFFTPKPPAKGNTGSPNGNTNYNNNHKAGSGQGTTKNTQRPPVHGGTANAGNNNPNAHGTTTRPTNKNRPPAPSTKPTPGRPRPPPAIVNAPKKHTPPPPPPPTPPPQPAPVEEVDARINKGNFEMPHPSQIEQPPALQGDPNLGVLGDNDDFGFGEVETPTPQVAPLPTNAPPQPFAPTITAKLVTHTENEFSDVETPMPKTPLQPTYTPPPPAFIPTVTARPASQGEEDQPLHIDLSKPAAEFNSDTAPNMGKESMGPIIPVDSVDTLEEGGAQEEQMPHDLEPIATPEPQVPPPPPPHVDMATTTTARANAPPTAHPMPSNQNTPTSRRPAVRPTPKTTMDPHPPMPNPSSMSQLAMPTHMAEEESMVTPSPTMMPHAPTPLATTSQSKPSVHVAMPIKPITGADGHVYLPVRNARVRVLGVDHDVVTDDFGGFWRLLAPGRSYTVIVSADGFKDSREDVFIGSTGGPLSINITLSRMTVDEMEEAKNKAMNPPAPPPAPQQTPTPTMAPTLSATAAPHMEPDSITDADGWEWKHNSYEEMSTKLKEIAEMYPNVARVESIGQSREGRELWVVKLTNQVINTTDPMPKVKFVGCVHGNEVVGREILLRMVEHLAKSYDSNPQIKGLLDTTIVHVAPCVNPDGYERKSRFNAAGVQISRDFPDQFCGKPESFEPETLALIRWSLREQFLLSASFYGGALGVTYPYESSKSLACNETSGKGTESRTPEDVELRYLAQTYAARHATMMSVNEKCDVDGPVFENGTLNGAMWYQQRGGMMDWNYWAVGTMEISVHLGCAPFPPASALPSTWASNKEAIVGFIREAHRGIKGVIYNTDTEPAAHGVVRVDNHATRTGPNGEYFRYLLPGTYKVEYFDEDSGAGNTTTLTVMPLDGPHGEYVPAMTMDVYLSLPEMRQVIGWMSAVLVLIGALGLVLGILYTFCRAVIYYCQGFRRLDTHDRAQNGNGMVAVSGSDGEDSGDEQGGFTRNGISASTKVFSDTESDDDTDSESDDDMFVNGASGRSVPMKQINSNRGRTENGGGA